MASPKPWLTMRENARIALAGGLRGIKGQRSGGRRAYHRRSVRNFPHSRLARDQGFDAVCNLTGLVRGHETHHFIEVCVPKTSFH